MADVLVTGSTGFVGSVLSDALESDGHRVYRLSRGAAAGPHTIQADITKPIQIGDLSFDCVFHLASLTPLVRDTASLREVNVSGSLNLFEAVRNKTKAFVYASGLGVYGKVGGPISEATPYNPDTEFARIRLEAHRQLEKKCESAQIPFSAVMFGDIYGPGGWFDNMVVRRMRAGTMMIPGGGKYQKAFLHVDDAAGILAAVWNSGLARPAYVAASPQSVTFREFVWYAADLLGVRRPRGAPAFAARLALGKDLIKLLCTPTTVSVDGISEMYDMRYPDYTAGLDATIPLL